MLMMSEIPYCLSSSWNAWQTSSEVCSDEEKATSYYGHTHTHRGSYISTGSITKSQKEM